MILSQTRPPRFGMSWRACVTAAITAALAVCAVGANAATPLTKEQRAQWRPVFTTIAHPPIDAAGLDRQMAANRTVPFWRHSLVSPVDSNAYSYTMVGKDPYSSKYRTYIHYDRIVARFHFADGTVLDPTQPTACDTQSAQARFFGSPLFKKTPVMSNGVDVSGPKGEQLISAFQRANYWSEIGGTNYGVEMRPHGPMHVVDITAPPLQEVVTVPIRCPSGAMVTVKAGLIDIAQFDSLVQSTIAKFAKPDELPIFMTYNVVEAEVFCCIIGYHNAVPVTNGTQTYAVGAYTDPGLFLDANGKPIAIEDIYAWSHELAEWMDDPFVQGQSKGGKKNNLTPAWGGTGQVSNCQSNLEVGDPLTAVAFYEIKLNGFTYHYQDLAFHDWFYRTPSQSTGGRFSFQGNFTTDAGAVCAG